MRAHARVVVIGGGVVGASCLYHLVRAGVADALLIEQDELTSGSTWHAAGNVPTYATSWLGMRAGNYAWRLYSELAAAVDQPITYRHTGAFWPAHTAERMDLFRHLVGVSRSAGFELAMLTPAEMTAMHPFYSAGDGVLGGIHDPYEGDIDPSQLTQALARAARLGGAEIARFTRVIGLERAAAGEWRVRTTNGDVTAEVVVNAAGGSGGRVGAMAGQVCQVVTLQHQYLVTEPLDALAAHPAPFPLVRDPDVRFYLRRERDAFLLGSYGHEGRPVWPDGPPADFAHQLFPDDPDALEGVIEGAIAHVPLLAEAGVQRFVNGPIPYSADAAPLCGPAFGLPDFYHACGVQVGITQAAACGKAIAEWVTEGETEWDLAAWDPRRFGEWATPDFARQRVPELYALQYAIPFPHRLLQAGRPVQTTPLYDTLRAKGAVFGQIGGWERACWFDRGGAGYDEGTLSFRDEPFRAAVRAECEAVRDAVGVMDHGGFTRYEVTGPGAAAFLDHVLTVGVPAVGRVKLTYLLTPKGMVWSEATVARLAEQRFLLCGPTLAEQRDFDWLCAHAPGDSVALRRGSDRDAALMVMGPSSRRLLQRLTEADLSRAAAPWLSVRDIRLAGALMTAMRVSFVGELGFELHLASADLPGVYQSIMAAGDDLGVTDFGSYALNAMRLEKGYHGWGADFGIEYTVFDAGLERFVNLDKASFVGREAVLRQRQAASTYAFAGFVVDSPDADALPSDPILLDGELVGYVTSAGTGFRVDRRLALGFVRRGTASAGRRFEIEVLGTRRGAICTSMPVYDPGNLRLKS